MAPSINNPSGIKNDTAEIRDAVVSDATRFPGGFVDTQVSDAGADVQIVGQFQLNNTSFVQSVDVSSQEFFPSGLALKPDGSKLYVIGRSSIRVQEYSLSTPFAVSTASPIRSFSVSSQDTAPTGLVFKPDGTQLYVSGSSNASLYQYTLSTAFDVSTASFIRSFDVSSQDTAPTGLVFRPDGTQLYVVGDGNSNVYEYSLSSAFDISTASFVQSLDVSPQDTTPTGLDFKPDGGKLYVIGSGSQNIHHYSLSTAFDISTASLVRSLDVSPQDTTPKGLDFKPDGSQIHVIGDQNKNVYQYVVGVIGQKVQ